VFPYSARAGTKAARLEGQVDGETRKARCQEMHALAAELKRRELERHLGDRAEVLWERRLAGGAGHWIGYTPHYHKIRSSRTDLEPARVTEVGIDAISADGSMLVSHAAGARVEIVGPQYHAAGS
jgi:tRNA A37 methylthiotransferase MiaB